MILNKSLKVRLQIFDGFLHIFVRSWWFFSFIMEKARSLEGVKRRCSWCWLWHRGWLVPLASCAVAVVVGCGVSEQTSDISAVLRARRLELYCHR